MSSSGIAFATLSANQRTALLNLLSDDEPSIYRAVREKILSYGPDAGEWLRPHRLSNDPVLRRRVLELIKHFDQQEADTRFLAFCLNKGEEFDIEEGAWLLASTAYPEINVDGYRAMLDNFTAALRDQIDFNNTPREILADINNYLFDELGFAGNEENYYDPENSYLNRVLDRRTGNPINLCLVYMVVGRRLKLPLTGIGLPGHFICRYQTTADEVYVDPFNRGRFLTKADCIQFLLNRNHSLRDEFLAPVTARRMLMRICTNLHQVYLQLDRADDTTRLQRYLVALAR